MPHAKPIVAVFAKLKCRNLFLVHPCYCGKWTEKYCVWHERDSL